MIRALVVDDEAPSREALNNYIKEFCTDVSVVGTASSVKTACLAVQKHRPDLVFLDIELPDGNGFDFLELYRPLPFNVIFVTAYEEYAVRAFRANAVDYLLKPVKIDELIDAIDKVGKVIRPPDNSTLDSLKRSVAEGNVSDPVIIISDNHGHEVLKIKDLVMCRADSYCTNFHLTKGRVFTASKNLKNYEEFLEKYKFVRVHHSYIVNLKHVTRFTKQGEIILTGNLKAFLGDRYKHEFLEAINCLNERQA